MARKVILATRVPIGPNRDLQFSLAEAGEREMAIVELVDDAGALLGEATRYWMQDGRLTGDRPGIQGSVAVIDGAGKLDLP